VDEVPSARISEHFGELEDPRSDNKWHQLLDIVVIAICAAICGADGWTDVELFGHAKHDWLKGFLELPHGIPSHDTFGRVFALLDAEQFEACFREWIQAVEELTDGQIVAIDGKTLRRSHDKTVGKEALHMLSAWASENGVVIGQMKVNAETNEITAIPQLLDMLEVSGCIVTIDAIGCQTGIVAQIIDQQADYVLTVKENQGRLHQAIQDLFDNSEELQWIECDHHQTIDKGHGRIEIRQCWSTSDPEYLDYIASMADWQDLRSIAMIQSERYIGPDRSMKRRYFISSLESNAQLLLHAVRTHWEIENKVHWVLDITFREDTCRVRKGNAPQNLAALRRIALNLLRGEKTAKCSIRAKRLKAGWDNDYLLRVLMG
jgi:predicted transposase YbfD/YdcC